MFMYEWIARPCPCMQSIRLNTDPFVELILPAKNSANPQLILGINSQFV